MWISNADGRTQLEKLSLEEFRGLYSDPPNEITQGDTLYWVPISLRTYPDDSHVIIDNLYGSELTDLATQDYEYMGVIIAPPPDKASLLEVFGLFRSPTLSNDSDENYWSVMHPDILILAALYHLEVSYRNSEGAKDWMNSLMLELQGVEKDWVEEDIAEVTQMTG